MSKNPREHAIWIIFFFLLLIVKGNDNCNVEKENGKVNQLDVGDKKDQQNSGSNNPRTSKNSKNKTK